MKLPSRKQRRDYNKKHKTSFSLQDFALMYAVSGVQEGKDISWLKPYLPTDLIPHKDNWDLFPDGTVVKLNYKGIHSRAPEYLTDEFKDWVEENKEEKFFVYRDPEEKDRRGLVSLRYVAESKNTDFSKALLFDLYSDLLVWSDLEKNYILPQKREDLENRIADVKQSLLLCDDFGIAVSDETRAKIEKIKKDVEEHENGTKIIAEPVEWQNMDSILQNIIENEMTIDDVEDTAKEVEDVVGEFSEQEETTEGGEE